MWPTWEDVGVPRSVVNLLKGLGVCPALDNLVHRIVFRSALSIYRQCMCEHCGYTYTFTKLNDDYQRCAKCESTRLKTNTITAYANQPPAYSHRSAGHLETISRQMLESALLYSRFIGAQVQGRNCGWQNGIPYVQFDGGELVTNTNVRYCIVKAALLCPYLWDFSHSEDRNDPTRHMTWSGILVQFTGFVGD